MTNNNDFSMLKTKEELGKKWNYQVASINMKKELQSKFPDTKFSVRSSSYSGGDSISVSWDDGASKTDVEKVINKYQGSEFGRDEWGNEDIKYSKKDGRNDFRAKFGSTDYVFNSREISEEFYRTVFKKIDKDYIQILNEVDGIDRMRWEQLGGKTVREYIKDTNFEKSQNLENITAPLQTEKQTYLYVPYSQKEQAKEVGCKYDPENKVWFAPAGTDINNISQWLLDVQQSNLNLNTQMTSDPLRDFEQEILQRGWNLKEPLVVDGKFHRVQIPGDKAHEKSGSYAIHQDTKSLLVLTDFRSGTQENIVHKESLLEAKADTKEFEVYREINRIKTLQRDFDTKETQVQVAKNLKEEIKTMGEAKTHPYLTKKGIEAVDGVKIDNKGNLVIPFYNANQELTTVQRISTKEDGTTLKMWEKDGVKKDSSFVIKGDFLGKGTVVICEGFSTGVSINAATKLPVHVAGDAGNIINIADTLAKRGFGYDDKIIIAADNDQYRGVDQNTGLNKANEAKDYILEKYPQMKDKITVIYPKFTSAEVENKLTDFNDLAQSRGNKEVARQIACAISKMQQVIIIRSTPLTSPHQLQHLLFYLHQTKHRGLLVLLVMLCTMQILILMKELLV